MVRGVYPPYTLSGPTTKKNFFLCVSSLSKKTCALTNWARHFNTYENTNKKPTIAIGNIRVIDFLGCGTDEKVWKDFAKIHTYTQNLQSRDIRQNYTYTCTRTIKECKWKTFTFKGGGRNFNSSKEEQSISSAYIFSWWNSNVNDILIFLFSFHHIYSLTFCFSILKLGGEGIRVRCMRYKGKKI